VVHGGRGVGLALFGMVILAGGSWILAGLEIATPSSAFRPFGALVDKHRLARSWTVYLFPVFLLLMTLPTVYAMHPLVFAWNPRRTPSSAYCLLGAARRVWMSLGFRWRGGSNLSYIGGNDSWRQWRWIAAQRRLSRAAHHEMFFPYIERSV